MNYDQQNKFYNHALKIVEKMGGHISAHGRWQGGVFLSVSVNHDRTYEKTRSIMLPYRKGMVVKSSIMNTGCQKVSFHIVRHL